MLWLYRLQQRLSITPAEGTALLVASGALVAGLAVRQLQASAALPAEHLLAEDDSLAAVDRAIAAGLRPEVPADTATTTPVAPAAAAEPARAHVRAPTTGPPAPHSISINTASTGELDRLPRIGPALAARIVEHRTRNGPFLSVDDLEAVRGIGPKMMEQIRPYARL